MSDLKWTYLHSHWIKSHDSRVGLYPRVCTLFGHTKPKWYFHICLQCVKCTASRLVIGTVLLLTVPEAPPDPPPPPDKPMQPPNEPPRVKPEGERMVAMLQSHSLGLHFNRLGQIFSFIYLIWSFQTSNHEEFLYENSLISHPSPFHKHMFASWQTLFH